MGERVEVTPHLSMVTSFIRVFCKKLLMRQVGRTAVGEKTPPHMGRGGQSGVSFVRKLGYGCWPAPGDLKVPREEPCRASKPQKEGTGHCRSFSCPGC